MTTTDTADQFAQVLLAHVLRTVDLASLSTEDKLALISLVQRSLDGDGTRAEDKAAQ